MNARWIKWNLTAGVLALILVGAPMYLYLTYVYPEVGSDTLYLALSGIGLIFVIGWGSMTASKQAFVHA
jgi:hypothetical protein